MQEHDERQLTDAELDAALRTWGAPAAPAGLRGKVLGGRERRSWWSWLAGGSIRVPVPVAVAVLLVVVAGLFAVARLRPRLVTRVEYREVAVPLSSISFQGLQPVDELRPRIIRRSHAHN
ncbi:MAG TPA: hypothetical protein VMJ34_22540 [Bryobacteraceae bacterium]|nr:hypothetical protein [Bryobacteraceae bacterium]